MSALRTQARRIVVQTLYSEEFGKDPSQTQEATLDLSAPKIPQEARDFAEELLKGICEQKDDLDKQLSEVSSNWSLDRIHPVERSILRLALFELNSRPDIPARVIINEAIDLAHRFGDDDAWRFVNGVLDEMAAIRPIEEMRGFLKGLDPTFERDEDDRV